MNIGLTGGDGERIAAKALADKGYKIIKQNYHSRFGEIDIIAKKGEYIIFAEVKTRGDFSISEPRESVTTAKQARIIKTALEFISLYGDDLQPRFDVIEVCAGRIRIYKNAFDTGVFLEDI